MKYSTLSLALLTGCSFNVSSCRSGGQADDAVDLAKLRAGIERHAAETATPAREVRCPAHIRAVEGASFECEVVLDAGTYAMVVRFHGPKAAVDWKQPLTGGAALERTLRDMVKHDGDSLDFDCGTAILTIGKTITCAVKGGSTPGQVRVWVNEDDRIVAEGLPE